MQPNKVDVLVDVQRALAEDVGAGDVTAALLPSDLVVNAMIISREPMLVCGRPWVDCVFSELDPAIEIKWLVDEGSWQEEPTTLCSIHGLARSILTAERSALNFMQTLSATATATHGYLQQLKGYHTQLLDTRKTLPGLRLAQKYAVACAGGVNHRLGLYDAFLIKENHIKACGSITQAIAVAKKYNSHLLIEVEVETLDELKEALNAKPSRILLDNFDHQMLVDAVALNKLYQCELEASGGVHLETIVSVAQTGVDYISVGAITKSIQAIDLSLLIKDIE
jgi:nicotinate-nucleotide pyrophosphorylase (carboxylating)